MEYFTSDYHLGHDNIREYCNRPFKTVEEMNTKIIERHNSIVKPEDTVFFIGDFCFKGGSQGSPSKAEEYKKRLNGNFIFIAGNHDRNNSLKTPIKNLVVECFGITAFLTHRPEDINFQYKYNFVGHVHQNWKIREEKLPYFPESTTLVINVGVDVWDFHPVSIKTLLKTIYMFKNKKGAISNGHVQAY